MDLKAKINLSRQVMIITSVFCAFTAFLLLLNFGQMKQNKPLESLALKALVDRLASDPNNDELKQEIRNLDLLARKAYFTSQWQVKTGAYLLLFGMIVFGFALWNYHKLLAKILKPEIIHQGDVFDRLISRKWILGLGVVFMVSALGASFLSNDYLKLYSDNKPDVLNTAGNAEKIELITIVKKDSSAGTQIHNNAIDQKSAVDNQISAVAVPQASADNTANIKTPVKFNLEDLKKQHNSFRGPLGQGISFRKNLPVDWNGEAGKNIIWKVPVNQYGYNSPVLWNEKLFLAGGDASARFVYCYDRNTGKLLWEKEVKGIEGSPSTLPDVSDDTGLSAPTVTVDGTAVYALFATGDLIAFDFSGNRLWAKNLGVPDNHYGHSSSLIIWDGKLIIQYDTNRGGRLIALNTANGQPVWDVKRENKISWASPILIQSGGKYQIVTSSVPFVAGHDIETGKELWKVDCMMGEVAPSPAFSDGLVFAANEYSKLVAIQPGDPVKILWQNDEYLPEASSPVAYQGLLYLATSYGVIACYDAKSGEKYWEHESGQGFYSSPIVADGKVYIVDLGGIMHIFKPGKQKVILGEPVLGEKVFTTPAFTDGRIYLRGQKNLYCIGNK